MQTVPGNDYRLELDGTADAHAVAGALAMAYPVAVASVALRHMGAVAVVRWTGPPGVLQEGASVAARVPGPVIVGAPVPELRIRSVQDLGRAATESSIGPVWSMVAAAGLFVATALLVRRVVVG